MAKITAALLEEINEGIVATLATGDIIGQNYDELTDGMQDTPTLQVYWTKTENDVTSETSQTTFRGKLRQKRLTYHVDLYARQRSHIGDDMGVLLPLAGNISEVLEDQEVKPYFGVDSIKAIERWDSNMIVFEYGDSGTPYLGTRTVIQLRIF